MLPLPSLFHKVLRSIKCCFQSIRILYSKLLEKNYSRSSFLIFLYSHFAFFMTEYWTKVYDIIRNRPYMLIQLIILMLISTFNILTSIHENIHISTVSMHITRKNNSSCIRILLLPQVVPESDERLCIVYCWMQKLTWIFPSSI